jgi:hypothetical protein
LGMTEGDGEVLLSSPPDERRDYKLVFIGAVSAEDVASRARTT